jgi:hypothetical protein
MIYIKATYANETTWEYLGEGAGAVSGIIFDLLAKPNSDLVGIEVDPRAPADKIGLPE